MLRYILLENFGIRTHTRYNRVTKSWLKVWDIRLTGMRKAMINSVLSVSSTGATLLLAANERRIYSIPSGAAQSCCRQDETTKRPISFFD
jgi:hypothetical protein